jgi:peptidyl-prolyl cis-trans isomerase B (cyclophilin B)
MKKLFALFSGIALLFASCDSSGDTDYLITIKTSFGDMKVVLYEETPLHKENFIELAQSGRYDSTIFHRVIENFMIQGGNVYEKEGTREKTADLIPAEFVPKYYHTKGALAAARQADQVNPEKRSSSCQFYIVDGTEWEAMSTDRVKLNNKLSEMFRDTVLLESDSSVFNLYSQFVNLQRQRDNRGLNELALESRSFVEEKYDIDLSTIPQTRNNEAYKAAGAGAPFLDMEYTVFGRVVEGLDVIDKIAAVKTGAADRPVEPVYLTMEVSQVSKKELSEKYGISYAKE